MKPLYYNSILIITTILSAWWDAWYIRKNGNLKGFRKVLHKTVTILVLSIMTVIFCTTYYSDWVLSFAYIPFVGFLYMFIFDPAIALMLGKGLLYLGNGKIDTWKKTWPPVLLWAFEIIGMVVTYNLWRLFV